jgi:rod shape-determining protein MreD
LPVADRQLSIAQIFLENTLRVPVGPIGYRQLAISNTIMPQLKIAAVLALSILLQLSLRVLWPPLRFIDFPLIVVVYIALQRDAWRALLVGTLAGIIVDAASGGLIGAGGFSKTLTAYIIYFAATKVNLENPLVRIPVLASATVLDSTVYVFWHRLLGYPPEAPLMQTISYKLIATTIAGTLVLYMLDSVISDRSPQQRQFATRRRVARRSTGTLRRR